MAERFPEIEGLRGQAMLLLDRLRAAGLDDGLVWLVPSSWVHGRARGGFLLGRPLHVAEVNQPLLAHRLRVEENGVAAGPPTGVALPLGAMVDQGDVEDALGYYDLPVERAADVAAYLTQRRASVARMDRERGNEATRWELPPEGRVWAVPVGAPPDVEARLVHAGRQLVDADPPPRRLELDTLRTDEQGRTVVVRHVLQANGPVREGQEGYRWIQCRDVVIVPGPLDCYRATPG